MNVLKDYLGLVEPFLVFTIFCCFAAMVFLVSRAWRCQKNNRDDFFCYPKEMKELRNTGRSCNDPPVRVFLQVATGELIDCFVIDWSKGGLGLFVRGDYAKLCKGQVALKPRDDTEGVWTVVKLCHSRPEAHGVFMGTQFIEEIKPSTLRRFRRKAT